MSQEPPHDTVDTDNHKMAMKHSFIDFEQQKHLQ